MAFIKAEKKKQKLRLAIDGVSGSGKTFTALSIASGLSDKIAVIDSEHGSSELYADRFNFDVLKLIKFDIEDYVNAIKEAWKEGYPVVIIDSTSHAWDALVERVERIAGQKYSGNTFRAWGEGTPLQRKLIEAMLSYPGHLIVTCRSKTEYSIDKDDKTGRTTVKKVGTSAVQRQGFEYEFTMAMTMDANHVGLVTKDRTGKFQDRFIDKPGKELGTELLDWLNTGAEVIEQNQQQEGGSDIAEKEKAYIDEFEKIQNDLAVYLNKKGIFEHPENVRQVIAAKDVKQMKIALSIAKDNEKMLAEKAKQAPAPQPEQLPIF